MHNKIALTTTFPNWADYPKEAIESWLKFLPEELLILIGLDPDQNLPNTEAWLQPMIETRNKLGSLFISREFPPEQIEFLKRHQPKEEKDYRMDYRRFSFKIFNLHRALDFCLKENLDYLIWLDADIILKKELPLTKIEEWFPKEHVISYLGRKDWDHSECGFMIFNLKNGGKEFLDRMISMYLNDEVLTLKQWHDSFVFDHIRKEFNDANKKDVFLNLTENVAGRDVFDNCILSEFMVHQKGPRKFKQSVQPASNIIDLNQLKVQTKNCVDHDVIKKNVTQNLRLIEKWVDICKPHDEEVVLVSAGPSLNVEEVRPLYEKGIKIVAVKHALDELLKADIIPWACMLLDPREHVKDFVKHDKAKEIIWLVASMVDPEVTRILMKRGCKVVGYHAYVGAEEQNIIHIKHKMVTGGSATATRGIAVLEWLGFRKFHLFAYDLCSLEKPDLKLKKGDRPIWLEANLAVDSTHDKKVTRTFWTKGEFLAQVQEMRNYFDTAGTDRFSVYGEGIIPWIFRHTKLRQKWLKDKNDKLFNDATPMNKFLEDSSQKSVAPEILSLI